MEVLIFVLIVLLCIGVYGLVIEPYCLARECKEHGFSDGDSGWPTEASNCTRVENGTVVGRRLKWVKEHCDASGRCE